MTNLSSTRICFIGAGNMASALAGGLIARNIPASNIAMSDINPELLLQQEKALGVRIFHNNVDAVAKADVIILAVKPQVMEAVVSPLKETLAGRDTLVISIAAGITVEKLQAWLGETQAIVRCMPNTPALVGTGASGLYANAQTSGEQRDIANAILQAAGIVEWFDEEAALDAVTALSGSGPAYFFLVMEAMIEAGKHMGLSEPASRHLTLQTALGAAQMAISSDVDVVELRRRVTSPGGTTQAAIESLQREQLEAIFARALKSAQQRSIELAKGQ